MRLVRPQLFFHCTLRPIGTAAGRFNSSDEDIPLNLVFFSPFEELRLRTAGIMESKGIHWCISPVPTVDPHSTSEGLNLLTEGLKPRMGGLSVAKTEKIRKKSRSEAAKRAWATKRARIVK